MPNFTRILDFTSANCPLKHKNSPFPICYFLDKKWKYLAQKCDINGICYKNWDFSHSSVWDFRHAESLTLNYGQQVLENVKEVLKSSLKIIRCIQMLSTQLKKKKEFLTVSHVKFFFSERNQGFSIDYILWAQRKLRDIFTSFLFVCLLSIAIWHSKL